MPMFRFRRLFWKTFLAFLLLNIIIMLATSYVVIATMGRKQFKEQHEQFVTTTAQRIIDRYERGQSLHWPAKPRAARPDHRWRDEFHRDIPLRIERDGNVIFHHPGEPRRHAKPMDLWLNGASGARYHVTTLELQVPRRVIATLFRLNVLQLVFIFLGSILASVLLSWSITHPLKQLGMFSRRYAENKTDTPLPDALLTRADEIGDLSRDFNYMISEVEKNLQAQKQLLHDVSHELRAPLARLQAAAALVELQHTENRDVARIHQECERMDALIQQILDFSRLGQNIEPLQCINLDTLVNEHIENLRYEYKNHHVVLNNQLASNELWVYPQLLDCALENVLRNACKYSPQQATITITLKNTGNHVIIEILDQGPGIAANEIEKVLTPFYRGGQQMHTDGFGLGLSIAKRAIALLGGSLRLANHANGGLQVQLIIPMGGSAAEC